MVREWRIGTSGSASARPCQRVTVGEVCDSGRSLTQTFRLFLPVPTCTILYDEDVSRYPIHREKEAASNIFCKVLLKSMAR